MAKKNKKKQDTKLKRFMIKFSGLLLILAALAVYVSLATYNPADPAFNNQNDNVPLNLLGGFGANLAEFVLFAFGVSLPLFLLGWLVWGYGLIRHNVIIEAKTGNFKTNSTTSFVTFNELTDNMIKSYIENCKPFDKAGAYGIQELPEGFVKNIEGDFENIVGISSKSFEKLLKNFQSG